MSAQTSMALGFVDTTLEQIMQRPGLWGSLYSVELQVLRLLEVRFVLCGGDPHETGVITHAYVDFLEKYFPDFSNSLWGRINETHSILDESEREQVLCVHLRMFVEDQVRMQDAFVPRPTGPQKPEYHPQDDMGRLGYLVEECAEVGQICGKIIRFGWNSFNPELPPEEQETNTEFLLHELGNASYAIDLMYRQLGARLPIPEDP